jgi:branched-chain amino acid transport system permease protein
MKIKFFSNYNFAIGLIFALAPLFFLENSYIIYALSLFFMYSILCIGLNLVIGVTGQFSLGHAAFYGMGAYISAIISTKLMMPYLLELLLSATGACVFAVFVAFSCARSGGDYLSVITLGIAEIFRIVCMNWVSVTGGPMGITAIPYPRLFSFIVNSNLEFYYLGLFYFLITVVLCNLILNSKYGRAFRAIRGDEVVAASMAVPVLKYKILVFGIGAFFAGIAGNYMVHTIKFVSPDNFTTDTSILLVQSIILGGLGTLKGSFIGAGLMLFLTEFLRIYPAAWRMLVIGVLIIIIMIKMPEGIVGTGINFRWFKKWLKKGGTVLNGDK